MAVALHRHFGWQIGVLVADIPNDNSATNRWPHPVHAYAISPNGVFLDAGGLTSEAQLTEEYLNTSRRKFWDPRFCLYDREKAFREFLHRTLAGPMMDTGLPSEELDVIGWFEKLLEEEIPKATDAIKVLELDFHASPAFSLCR